MTIENLDLHKLLIQCPNLHFICTSLSYLSISSGHQPLKEQMLNFKLEGEKKIGDFNMTILFVFSGRFMNLVMIMIESFWYFMRNSVINHII